MAQGRQGRCCLTTSEISYHNVSVSIDCVNFGALVYVQIHARALQIHIVACSL